MKVGRQLLTLRERRAVYQEIEPAELTLDFGEDLRDLRIVGHIAGEDEGIGQAGGELADVLFETLALVRDREARAGGRRGLRDGPTDRALVGHADDEAGLAVEISHRQSLPFSADLTTKYAVLKCEAVANGGRGRSQRERFLPPP